MRHRRRTRRKPSARYGDTAHKYGRRSYYDNVAFKLAKIIAQGRDPISDAEVSRIVAVVSKDLMPHTGRGYVNVRKLRKEMRKIARSRRNR